MIKEQVKCPKCGKVLLRGYSTAVTQVICKCGKTIDVKRHFTAYNLKKVEDNYANC